MARSTQAHGTERLEKKPFVRIGSNGTTGTETRLGRIAIKQERFTRMVRSSTHRYAAVSINRRSQTYGNRKTINRNAYGDGMATKKTLQQEVRAFTTRHAATRTKTEKTKPRQVYVRPTTMGSHHGSLDQDISTKLTRSTLIWTAWARKRLPARNSGMRMDAVPAPRTLE